MPRSRPVHAVKVVGPLARKNRHEKWSLLYGTRRYWNRVSKAHRERHPLCAMCGDAGHDVDHIQALSDGGTNHPSNLQTLCRPCHGRKTMRDVAEREASAGPIIVITGPPGSGKTTWVRDNRGYADLVLDLDAIAAALTLGEWHDTPNTVLPFALDLYDRAVDVLEQHKTMAGGTAWVICAGYKRAVSLASRLGAELRAFEVEPDVCLKRIMDDGSRRYKEHWRGLVYKWWEERGPRDHKTMADIRIREAGRVADDVLAT